MTISSEQQQPQQPQQQKPLPTIYGQYSQQPPAVFIEPQQLIQHPIQPNYVQYPQQQQQPMFVQQQTQVYSQYPPQYAQQQQPTQVYVIQGQQPIQIAPQPYESRFGLFSPTSTVVSLLLGAMLNFMVGCAIWWPAYWIGACLVLISLIGGVMYRSCIVLIAASIIQLCAFVGSMFVRFYGKTYNYYISLWVLSVVLLVPSMLLLAYIQWKSRQSNSDNQPSQQQQQQGWMRLIGEPSIPLAGILFSFSFGFFITSVITQGTFWSILLISEWFGWMIVLLTLINFPLVIATIWLGVCKHKLWMMYFVLAVILVDCFTVGLWAGYLGFIFGILSMDSYHSQKYEGLAAAFRLLLLPIFGVLSLGFGGWLVWLYRKHWRTIQMFVPSANV